MVMMEARIFRALGSGRHRRTLWPLLAALQIGRGWSESAARPRPGWSLVHVALIKATHAGAELLATRLRIAALTVEALTTPSILRGTEALAPLVLRCWSAGIPAIFSGWLRGRPRITESVHPWAHGKAALLATVHPWLPSFPWWARSGAVSAP